MSSTIHINFKNILNTKLADTKFYVSSKVDFVIEGNVIKPGTRVPYRTDSAGLATIRLSVGNYTITVSDKSLDFSVYANNTSYNLVDIINLAPVTVPSAGLPTGGTTGQVLTKNSNNNYDVEWIDQSGGGLVAGLLDYRGGYNASSNTYPTTGGSGMAEAVMKGDMWVISVAGILGGVAIQVGDSIIANVDSPGQTSSNWNTLNTNISYVAENQANKSDSYTVSSSTTYSSTKALVDGLANKTDKLIITNRQTNSYTLVLSDADKLVEINNASANNLTVPLNSAVAYPVGTQILIAQYGVGQTTIVATGGVTIRSNGSKLKLTGQFALATLIKISSDEWYLSGNLTT